MSRAYLHYDVFTREPLTGNQLAVYLDGRGLEASRMQALAREMAFSETTFILPPESADTDVRMRIFTPGTELPMAGHPTIGSTFALAETGVIKAGAERFVFGLGVGPIPVALEWNADCLRFAWMTQLVPTFGRIVTDVQSIAAALGVRRDDIAGELPIQEISCGNPFILVPVDRRAAVDAASPDGTALRRLKSAFGGDHIGVFMFSLEPVEPDVIAYSRMFGAGLGIVEDPATGSASGPLGCYLVAHQLVPHGRTGEIVSLQGVAMGRPSRIHIAITTDDRDEIARVQVGGKAVRVGEGTITVG